MAKDYYSTKDASALTGASRQVIRVYTDRYARYLSTEATPGPGKERRFTVADLKLIAYVYQQTGNEGQTHDQVEQQLAAGALDTFAWEPPEPTSGASQTPESATSPLVPAERLQAALALLQDAQRRETDQAHQVQQLSTEIARLQNELGKAQGALDAYKSMRRRPKWWSMLFGGE
jgi:DNA-binding transcriptional MerR regulator